MAGLNKDNIRQAVDAALENVLKAQDRINNSNDIIDSVDLDDEIEAEKLKNNDLEKTENTELKDLSSVDEENVDIDVQDKVTEVIEEEVSDKADYSFLGLDISISKTEEGVYEVTIRKDDFEKTEEVDSIDINNILNLVENFFSELVIDDSLEESEKSAEEEEEEIKEDTDNEEDEFLDNEEDLLEEDDSSLVSNIQTLKEKYKDNVDSIFEQGLLAKNLVIDILKDKLVAGTVKELIDRVNEKDSLIASKHNELYKANLNYLLAQKLNTKLKKSYSLVASQMNKIKEELDKNEDVLSPETVKKLNKFYYTVVAKILDTNKAEDIEALSKKFEKTTNTLLASVVKVKPTFDKVSKREINSEDKLVIASNKPVNILNRESWTGNKTIMSHRYEGIDEMSAEILRIAGIN